mgnify:FL=1
MWQRDAQWKYSCICADASDRVRVVLPWRYERWTDQDAIICRFDDPFSWGVCKYCRFPWKEAYDGRSRTVMSMAQGVAMPGGIMQDWIFF